MARMVDAVRRSALEPSAVSYDKAPYDSKPFHISCPAHLYAIAKLFGVAPVRYDACRVLELGCASGGNITPIAYHYPNVECVAVDLSRRQIEEGQRCVEALRLKNISLRHMSIMDITPESGVFDYIIVHGVLSWVPPQVRSKIFAICQHNLSPNGIAYVSYNTLPGWGAIKGISALLDYHTQHLADPYEKARQGYALLECIQESGIGSATDYSDVIATELHLMQQLGDSYLIHEHLEDENHAYYFHEFMQQVEAHGLSYISDANIHKMSVRNLPQKIADMLPQYDNTLEAEQYIDFLCNTRFRASVLCRNTMVVSAQPQAEGLNDLYITAEFTANEQASSSTQELHFTSKRGEGMAVMRGSIAAIALSLLAQHTIRPIAVKQWIRQVQQSLGKYQSAIAENLKSLALDLIVKGAVMVYAEDVYGVVGISPMPKASELARYQAKTTDLVTNRTHNQVTLDEYCRAIIHYWDGQHFTEDVINIISTAIQSKALPMPGVLSDSNGSGVCDTRDARNSAALIVNQSLQILADSALLEA